MFANFPQMASGIAKAEFLQMGYGEGFIITNNENDIDFYYPVSGKFFTDDQNKVAQKKLPVKQAGDRTDNSYAFTVYSNDYSAEGIQLIQFTKKLLKGGRVIIFIFSGNLIIINPTIQKHCSTLLIIL